MDADGRAAALHKGRETLRIEAEAVAALRLGEAFADAVELILSSSGQVVVTGMGKSGIIARKIVATLISTGTPALFLHPAEAVHGDLGLVRPTDVVLALSKSGATREISELLPAFRRLGVPIIALVGRPGGGEIGRLADLVLDASVPAEACPLDLAPTASTTAALALGDALAVALLDRRGFTADDFALNHPGGSLGKRLQLSVGEMMAAGSALPVVGCRAPLAEALLEMTTKRLGATAVTDETGALCGILVDGDLRRLLARTHNIAGLTVEEVMSHAPKTTTADVRAAVALRQMEEYAISQLIVVDEGQRPVGMVHLHDLVRAGLT